MLLYNDGTIEIGDYICINNKVYECTGIFDSYASLDFIAYKSELAYQDNKNLMFA